MPHFPLRLTTYCAAGLLVAGACARSADSPQTPAAAAASSATTTAAAPTEAAPAGTPPVDTSAPSTGAVASKSAVDCVHPFGLADGTELTYQLLAKDKPDGLHVMKVARISFHEGAKKAPAYTEVLLKSSLYTPDNRLLSNDEYVYQCRRDTVLTDGRQLLDPATLRSFRDRRFTYEPTPLAWPNQPTPGPLPNGGLKVQVSSPSVDIAQVRTEVRQRVLSGPEAVTTPAGTFQCYKVVSRYEYVTQARSDLARRSARQVTDYYSPSLGLIRSETGDAGKQPDRVMVLVKRTTEAPR